MFRHLTASKTHTKKKIKNKLKKNTLIHIYNVNLQFIKHLKTKIMKIKTTQTTTETKEVEVSLPAFTKIKSTYSTGYYYVHSEDKTTRIEIYSHGIKNFSQIDNYRNAFADGFEFISEEEFIKMYELLVNEVRIEFNQIKLDLEEVTEKEEDQGFEYNPETETMN